MILLRLFFRCLSETSQQGRRQIFTLMLFHPLQIIRRQRLLRLCGNLHAMPALVGEHRFKELALQALLGQILDDRHILRERRRDGRPCAVEIVGTLQGRSPRRKVDAQIFRLAHEVIVARERFAAPAPLGDDVGNRHIVVRLQGRHDEHARVQHAARKKLVVHDVLVEEVIGTRRGLHPFVDIRRHMRRRICRRRKKNERKGGRQPSFHLHLFFFHSFASSHSKNLNHPPHGKAHQAHTASPDTHNS